MWDHRGAKQVRREGGTYGRKLEPREGDRSPQTTPQQQPPDSKHERAPKQGAREGPIGRPETSSNDRRHQRAPTPGRQSSSSSLEPVSSTDRTGQVRHPGPPGAPANRSGEASACPPEPDQRPPSGHGAGSRALAGLLPPADPRQAIRGQATRPDQSWAPYCDQKPPGWPGSSRGEPGGGASLWV